MRKVTLTVLVVACAVNVAAAGAASSLPNGTYRYTLTTGDMKRAGVRSAGDIRGNEGTWTWTLTSGREAMSAHVVVDDVGQSERLLEALHAVLHARFGIDHTTVQLETAPPVLLPGEVLTAGAGGRRWRASGQSPPGAGSEREWRCGRSAGRE